MERSEGGERVALGKGKALEKKKMAKLKKGICQSKRYKRRYVGMREKKGNMIGIEKDELEARDKEIIIRYERQDKKQDNDVLSPINYPINYQVYKPHNPY